MTTLACTLARAPILVALALLVAVGTAPVVAAGASPGGLGGIFQDGFESGTTCWWSAAVPEDVPPGVDCGLAGFEPLFSFVREGETGAPTIPLPLTARLYRPAPANTFVDIASGDPSSLSVTGGGVTIATGTSEAVVLVDALAQNPGVTLVATLATVQLQATVRVVGASETPTLVAFEPAAVTIPTGGSVDFEVVLDLPAPIGGTMVALASTPGLGSLPSNVLVSPDQVGGSFTYVAGGVAGVDTLSATLGATTLFATVTITD